MARWQISIDDELAEKIESYTKANFMSKSGFISFVSNQFLVSNSVMQILGDMSFSLQKMAEKGSFTEEDKKELQDFTRALEMLSAGK